MSGGPAHSARILRACRRAITALALSLLAVPGLASSSGMSFALRTDPDAGVTKHLVSAQWGTQTPPGAAVVAPFVPTGWCVEQIASGQLDGDGLEDAAVTLLYCGSSGEMTTDAKRALLVLLGETGGRLRRVELLTGLLPCRSCLGMLGGPAGQSTIDVAIERQRLVVGWLRGSRESVEVTIELGVNDGRTGLRLLRDDVERVDRVLGKATRRVRDFAAGLEIKNGTKRPLGTAPVPASSLRFEDY